MYPVLFVFWLSHLVLTSAKTIVITVGGNTTSNPGSVFLPQSVRADQDDIILFNFTQGNHSATQSTFASPCVQAHKTNSSINGFDSWYREAGNYTAITQLTYVVADAKVPLWFFDYNLCGKGGVGAINSNESSNETLAGFVRNSIRLNGTRSSGSSSISPSAIAGTPSATPSRTPSSANRAIVVGFYVATPALVILAALSL